MSAKPKERTTRKPTGIPPWPTILLAGGEKSGKSWSAAEFSGSDMVGRTFYIEIGEHYADEYGRIPGVRYEIVEHDGSYRDILEAVRWAVRQERVDGKPNSVILDSATVLWDMLSDQAQQAANSRWHRKHPNAKEPDDEIKVTMDLWNIAKGKFAAVIAELYVFDGPAIVTARLEQVAVVGGNGQPTTEKAWKVRAEKNLPFEVDAVIQAREPRKFQITGLRSTRFQLPIGETIEMPGFTVEGFLRNLGLDQEGATAPRSVTPLEDPAAPAPLREPQPHRPKGAERSNHAEPDQWDAKPAPRGVSDGQLKALHALIAQKYGPKTDAERHASFSKFTRREVTSAKQLTYDEASAYMDVLAKQPDYVAPTSAPNPRENPRIAPSVEYALTHSTEEVNAARARQEAELLAANDPDTALRRAESGLRDQIESADSAEELDGTLAAVWNQAGWLGPKVVEALEAAAELRAKTLGLQAQPQNGGFSHRMLAGQGAAL